MDPFRIDSINQMALKQIAAVKLPADNGPFVLGKPDPALADIPPGDHPLTRYLLRLMHDEPLDVEQQNDLAALAVQVIHFGDLNPLVQWCFGAVLEQGRPQHVVTLKLNKVLRDVLHLAHGHQTDIEKIFVEGAAPVAPAKPPPDKQRVIMVKDDPLEARSAGPNWSPVRNQNSYQPPASSSSGSGREPATVERVIETERAVVSPGLVAFGAGLVTIPIAAAIGAQVGITVTPQDGWTVFFLVLLPSEVLIALGGALGHFIWKSMRE